MITIDTYFEDYDDILMEIKDLNIELISLKNDWYELTGTNFDKIIVSGYKNIDIANQLHLILEKEKKLAKKIAEKEEFRKLCETIYLSKMKNRKAKRIIRLSFLEKLSNKQISYNLNLSYDRIRHLKKEAIIEFENILNEKTTQNSTK